MTLLARLTLAAVLIVPVTAGAATPRSNASAPVDTPGSLRIEAHRLLTDCDVHGSQEKKEMCEVNEDKFVTSYLCAFAGNYDGQQNVAMFLYVNNGIPEPGVAPVDLLSCAWASIVVLDNPLGNSGDVDTADRYCSTMDESARHAAGVKAALIAARIKAVVALDKPAEYCPWMAPERPSKSGKP